MRLIWSPTWPCVDRLWFPIWITVIVDVCLLEGLYWLVLVYERIASIVISDQVCDDATYCVWALSDSFQYLSGWTINYLPQITTNGICDFEQ